jgi:hypothetical protein
MLSPARIGNQKKLESQAEDFVYQQIESNLAKPSYSNSQTDQRIIAHPSRKPGVLPWAAHLPQEWGMQSFSSQKQQKWSSFVSKQSKI